MKRYMRRVIFICLLCAPLHAFSAEIIGAGRSMAAPVFSLWAKNYGYTNPSLNVKYQVSKNADALKQLAAGNIDFVETDSPQIKKALDKNGLLQFPYMFSAIAPVVNIPNVLPGQLKLNGAILADIFLGNISKWNDPKIQEINPKLSLPDESINVAYINSDEGGSYSFTNYLASYSQEWADKIGVGSALTWPTGKGLLNLNEMKEFIENNPYSIGYSEISFARKSKLSYVQLLNTANYYAYPNIGNIDKQIKKIKWNSKNGFNENFMDMPGVESWPLAVASYIIIKRDSDNAVQRKALLDFLGWGLRAGDMHVATLDFLPADRTLYKVVKRVLSEAPLGIAGVAVIKVDTLKEMISNGAILIDTRTDVDYKNGHIVGAKLITYLDQSEKVTNFNSKLDSFDLSRLPGNKSSEIIFYANSEEDWEAYKASVVAKQSGYKNIFWLRGGFTEWVQLGNASVF